MSWPITWDDILAAGRRIAPYLPATPLRNYAALDAEVGADIRVLVKHENHQPTNAFKVRNAMSFMTALSSDLRARGVVAASRGNHGAGLAYAGAQLGTHVVICVPRQNNAEKNAMIAGFGAELIEEGTDYDTSIEVAEHLVETRGLVMAHSTNDASIVAGAGTLSAEICEQAEVLARQLRRNQPGDAADASGLDAIVVSVGGGSQAVGALVATRALCPGVEVYGVQATGASAIHDAWHSGIRTTIAQADTFADGLATRTSYDLTWEPLRDGLAGFVAVNDAAIAAALRMLLRTTHNLAEGAGAAGLAGVIALREQLAGKTVAVVLSGANIDMATLGRVLSREM